METRGSGDILSVFCVVGVGTSAVGSSREVASVNGSGGLRTRLLSRDLRFGVDGDLVLFCRSLRGSIKNRLKLIT